MKVNQYISKKEHLLLFITVCFGLVLRIINVFVSVIETDKTSAGFSYSIFDMEEMMSPLYSFAVFLLCIFLIWNLNFITVIFSIILTSLLSMFFDRWFIETQVKIDYAAKRNLDYEFKTLDFVLLSGSVFDVVTFLIVNFLLFWQISILLRMLIKTTQKIELP